MTASLKKVYIFISEGEGIAKTKTRKSEISGYLPAYKKVITTIIVSNIYVASWVQGVSKGTTNKGSTISKISYSKKAVNVHGCVWGCELSCETSLNQFTVVLDVYSANTLARDNFLGRQYLHFDLLTPGKFKKVYPSRPPHDPTAQTCLAYYTQYGTKTALALVDKCDSAVFKDYLYMDHVQAMSRHCESKGGAERSKRHTVQGTLTISCLVVDNRKAAIQNKKSGSGSSLKERPLPLPPAAPTCPSYRAPPPPPPQDEPGSVKDIAVAVKSPLHQQQALEQDTTYESYDPSQEGDCYEPYDPSQIDEGGDSVYSLVGQCVKEIDLDGGQAADAKGLHEVSYDPVAAGSGEDGRDYEYVRLSRHSSAAVQAYISPGVGDHSGEPESPHEGTPGVEQRLEERLEQGLEEGLEQGLEEGLEPGLEEGLEQGLEEGLEQGLEEGLEQDLEEGLEQGLEEGLEQGLEEGLESPLGASPSLQQDTPTSPFGSPIPDCAEDDVYDDVVITRHGNGIVHYGDEPTITNCEDVYDDVVIAPDPDQSPYQSSPTPYQAPPISQSSEAPPTTALSVLPALVHQMEANAAPSQTTPIMQAPPSTTPIMQAPPPTTPIMQAPPSVLPAAAPLRQSHYQATPITPPTSCPKGPEQSCTVRPRPRPPSRSSSNPFLPPAPSSPTAHSHTPRPATPTCQSSDPATAYNQVPPTPQPQAANSDLPPGWEAVRTSDGRVYYVHRQSKVASWDRPFVAPDGPVPPPPSIPAPPPPSIEGQETGLKSLGALQGMTNRPTVPPPQGVTTRPTVPPPQGMTNRPTVPPPQGMTNRPTVPPPQGMTNRPTVPPPQGMTNRPTVPPPQGMTNRPTVPPPQGMTNRPTVPPPQGMTNRPTVPPPQGMTNRPTVPPPQGMTNRPTVPPPQGMTTVPPPQGMTTVPPPQGMTTVPPPQGMTTVPPPQGMTNRPTAPPFQGDDTQSPIDWDPRIDLDWDIYNANDDDDVMMGQATPNFNNQPTLPPGWERKITPEGRVYYLDHNTRRTQWEDPRLQSPSTVNLSPAPVNPLVAAPSSLNPSVVTRPPVNPLMAAPSPVNPLMAAPSPANPLMSASSPVNPLMAASSLVNPLMAASPSPSILGPLPPGWEIVRMSDGRMYYVNNHMHLSQWEDPRLQARNPFGASLPMQGTGLYMGLGTGPYIGLGPLPIGWEVRRTPEGHTYYVDNRTNRTQWEDPRLQTPLLQSYKQKLVYFRSTLPVASNGVLAITAHRGSLLEDSYSAIMNVKDILQLRSKPKVQFYGDPEVVSSNDGQLREWLQLLSQIILNPSCGLFQHLTSQRPQLLINPDSGLYNPGHLEFFRFYGRVCGLAIYNNMIIDAFFIRPFYKMMLGKKVTFEDMQSVDFKLYNTLGFIMSNVLRTAHLRFSVKNTVFEELQDDLKPNGRNISVTEENKREYVDLMVTWRLVSRVKDQMDAFMKGFSDVIPPNLIQVFDERELEYLMGGLAEIDVEDWKKNTEYIGYTANDDVIVWFWKAVSSYDNEMRTRLLQFVTGMSSVPRRGFAMLQGLEGLRKFTISKAEDDQALPRAAVSFNILHLPPYGDQMQLVKMLSAALLEPKALK